MTMRIVLPAAVVVLAAALHSPRGTDAPTASMSRVARRSVVKVVGVAADCQLEIQGSGFVYAPEHVMTNAHVVAGVAEPHILTQDNHTFTGRVVLYDPRRDIAVIDVPHLNRPPLTFDTTAHVGTHAVVAGFPEDGPFTANDARVRSKQQVRDSDIYHTTSIRHEIYIVRGQVRHGNSGGPLLSSDGKVYGLVFAMATNHENVGYALTADEVSADAQAGQNSDNAVPTRSCSTAD